MRKKNQGPRGEKETGLPTLVLAEKEIQTIKKLATEPKEPGTRLREAAKKLLAS